MIESQRTGISQPIKTPERIITTAPRYGPCPEDPRELHLDGSLPTKHPVNVQKTHSFGWLQTGPI
jgi:hypothetical protein